jgi:hypothetical protein
MERNFSTGFTGLPELPQKNQETGKEESDFLDRISRMTGFFLAG